MTVNYSNYMPIALCLWGLLNFSTAFAQSPPITSVVSSPEYIRVIVRLNIPFQPEGELTRARALDQQTRIAATQTRLLQRFKPTPMTVNHRYRYVPHLALTIDSAILTQLAQAPEVAAIQLDTPERVNNLADSVSLIGADQAWAEGYSGAGWTVAVLDAGLETSHDWLKGKVVAEACFSTTDTKAKTLCPNGQDEQVGLGAGVNCPPSVKDCEHGTHVAGIVAGVAKEATLIAVQVMSRYNQSDECGTSGTPCVRTLPSDQMAALEQVYAWRDQFHIAAVNMSLGSGRFDSPCDNDSRRNIINTLRSVNIAVVVSSGNDGQSNALSAPACISTTVSVGATNITDTVVSFSNSASFLDFLAPGEAITSSIPGNTFGLKSGTSMAAPHVAGAWAILKSKDPTATLDQIYDTLANTGIPLTDPRNGITKPRIQINAALQPNIALTPQISPPNLIPQQPFTYVIKLKNSGLVTLTHINIMATWPQGLSPSLPDVLTQGLTLRPAQAITLTYPTTLTVMLPARSLISQTMWVTAAELRLSLTQTFTTSIATYPALTVTKTADVPLAFVGHGVTFTYHVTNTGNITVQSVRLYDAQFGQIELTSDELAMGQTLSSTRRYTLTPLDLRRAITPSLTLDFFSMEGQNLIITAPNSALQVGLPTYLPILHK